MYSIRIEEGDIWREVRRRNYSSALPTLSYLIHRSSVDQRKAVLDSIPVPIEDEHKVLSVRSKLQLKVLLLLVEEERLHHLVLPQLKVGLSNFSSLGCWVPKIRCSNGYLQIATHPLQRDLGRRVVHWFPVPGQSYCVGLLPFHGLLPQS